MRGAGDWFSLSLALPREGGGDVSFDCERTHVPLSSLRVGRAVRGIPAGIARYRLHTRLAACRRQGGYSLLELVMVMVIVGVIGVTLATLLSGGVGAFTAGREAVDTLSELRLAGERVARELRTVRRDPTTPANFDFLSRTANSVQFRRLENDGTTVTTVTIDSSGSDLRIAYNTPAGTYTLTDRLANPGGLSFTYWQQNGTTAATTNADVAFVDIELRLTDSNSNVYPQRTRVALRNRQ